MTQQTQADGCQHWGDPGQNRESTSNRWATVGTVALVAGALLAVAGLILAAPR